MTDAIDELDQHILYALQQDARHTSSGDIAENRGVSASTVRKRTQRLETEGIISDYHVEIDYEAALASRCMRNSPVLLDRSTGNTRQTG